MKVVLFLIPPVQPRITKLFSLLLFQWWKNNMAHLPSVIVPPNCRPLSAIKSSLLPREDLDPSSSWHPPPVTPNSATSVFILSLCNDCFPQARTHGNISSNFENMKPNQPALYFRLPSGSFHSPFHWGISLVYILCQLYILTFSLGFNLVLFLSKPSKLFMWSSSWLLSCYNKSSFSASIACIPRTICIWGYALTLKLLLPWSQAPYAHDSPPIGLTK